MLCLDVWNLKLFLVLKKINDYCFCVYIKYVLTWTPYCIMCKCKTAPQNEFQCASLLCHCWKKWCNHMLSSSTHHLSFHKGFQFSFHRSDIDLCCIIEATSLILSPCTGSVVHFYNLFFLRLLTKKVILIQKVLLWTRFLTFWVLIVLKVAEKTFNS